MSELFEDSEFNGDISKWNTSNVTDISALFYDSQFNGNINEWKPEKVEYLEFMFEGYDAPKPWWFNEDVEQIKKNLQAKDLNNNLS